MGFLCKTIAVIFAAVVIQHVMKLYVKMGYLKHVYNHEPGPCHIVDKNIHGSEDLQTLSSGLAIISSGLQFMAFPISGGTPIEGVFYTFDFNYPEAGLTKLESDVPVENPHGLSLWEDAVTGGVTMFVVNHAKRGELIEKFEFDQKTRKLKHIKSIADPVFINLNDVVATSPDTFYVTNHFGTANKWTQKTEIWLLLPFGGVVYHNGVKGEVVLSNLLTPNGVNRSPDGRFLYLATPLANSVSVYTIESATKLSLRSTYPIDGIVDNIDVAEDGSLWLGVHTVCYKLMEYMEDPKKESPSQVLRLQLEDGHITHAEEVYAGVLVSGSTVASYRNGSMLVGTVLSELMYCKVNQLIEN